MGDTSSRAADRRLEEAGDADDGRAVGSGYGRAVLHVCDPGRAGRGDGHGAAGPHRHGPSLIAGSIYLVRASPVPSVGQGALL